jgi:hypothetical protein
MCECSVQEAGKQTGHHKIASVQEQYLFNPAGKSRGRLLAFSRAADRKGGNHAGLWTI